MSALTPSCIIFNANKIMSNPVLLQQHMSKAKPCHFGIDCKRDLSECAGAHFLEEFRVPICLFLHICKKKDCTMYHPNMGTAQEYITFMGIDKVLPTHEKWISVKDSVKDRRENVIKGAKHTISNPDLLRKHLTKTRSCFHGLKCRNKESCCGAHFLDEYRLPICLYLEFCQDKACKAFHPHLGKTKEQFMEENNINLPIRKIEENELVDDAKDNDIVPLTGRNRRASPSPIVNSKKNTALCSFVKNNSKCKRAGCSFAHSIIDLNLPIEQGASIEKKREMAERIFGTIPDFFMNPSYMNSEYINMLKKQEDLVDDLRRQENGEENDENLSKDDEENIEEFLKEIEYEQAKEDFLMEMDLLELGLEEFNFAESDSEDDNEENHDELKVKITINSISQIETLEKAGKINKEKMWNEEEKW